MAAVTETFPGTQPVVNQKSDVQVVPSGEEDNWWSAADSNIVGGHTTAIVRALRLNALLAGVTDAAVTINGKAFSFNGLFDGTTGLPRIDKTLTTDLQKLWVTAIEKIEQGGDLDGTASATPFLGVGRGLISGAFVTNRLYGLSSDGALITYAGGALPPKAIGRSVSAVEFLAEGRVMADNTNVKFNSSGALVLNTSLNLTSLLVTGAIRSNTQYQIGANVVLDVNRDLAVSKGTFTGNVTVDRGATKSELILKSDNTSTVALLAFYDDGGASDTEGWEWSMRGVDHATLPQDLFLSHRADPSTFVTYIQFDESAAQINFQQAIKCESSVVIVGNVRFDGTGDVRWDDNAAPVDEKIYRYVFNAGAFSLDMLNDAEDSSSLVWRVDRTGTTVDFFEIFGNKINLGVGAAVGTDPGKTTFADFYDFIVKDILVSVGGSAVASVDIGFDLPKGAAVLGAQLNIQSAITGAGGATAIGLGISTDVDKYGETATLVLDAKSTEQGFGTSAITAIEDLDIHATNGAGVATGTIQNGSVRVRLLFAIPVDLPNA